MSNEVQILIIDDDPEYVEGIQTVLAKAGYAVERQGNFPDPDLGGYFC